MRCPHCNSDKLQLDHIPSWDSFSGAPVECSECGGFYWASVENIQLDKNKFIAPADDIPPMECGKWVYIFNKQHVKHLDPGVIVNKSHIHYRIKFTDGIIIWMPEHWVKPVPVEML